MQNSPELDGKYLGTVSRDFIKVCDSLSEASYLIRKNKISDFPIFAICKQEQPIGRLLIDKNESATDWNYFASFEDEFTARGLIDAEKKQEFVAAYKNPDEFCCLFVIDPEFTNFLFIPYPTD